MDHRGDLLKRKSYGGRQGCELRIKTVAHPKISRSVASEGGTAAHLVLPVVCGECLKMSRQNLPARTALATLVFYLLSSASSEFVHGFTSNNSIRAFPPTIVHDVAPASAGNGTSRAEKRKSVEKTDSSQHIILLVRTRKNHYGGPQALENA